jgi:hypothetical protein
MKRAILIVAGLFLLAQGSLLAQVKFSGLMFGDYYFMADNHDPTQKNVGAFEYRRIYLTADYTVADDMWARFRMESDPTASNLGNNKLSTMVKDAFLDWKNAVGTGDLVIGLQGTWNINMAEGIFGYRPLEKTIQDLHGISASRDMGVSLTQKFSDQFSAGFLLGNNTGNGGTLYNQPNTSPTRYKSGYLFLQYAASGLTVLVDGQYASAAASHNMTTFDGIVNYATSQFSIGAQGFVNTAGKANPDGSDMSRNGISLNGWLGLMDNVRIVLRYDNYVANSSSTYKNTSIATSTQSFILAGLDFAARKNVHFMPNIEYTTYGLSGSKADVVYRLTYFFSF